MSISKAGLQKGAAIQVTMYLTIYSIYRYNVVRTEVVTSDRTKPNLHRPNIKMRSYIEYIKYRLTPSVEKVSPHSRQEALSVTLCCYMYYKLR